MGEDLQNESKLRIASCQFPVTVDIRKNSQHIVRYLKRARDAGAHLLHTSEACLSGYAGTDFEDLRDMDWALLRAETERLREQAASLGLWLVLGSSHYLDEVNPPTNCLYLIGSTGAVVDRYDKRMLTPNDQKAYSAGTHFSVNTIRGVRVGLAICFDSCFPQLYAAYRERGVELMLHSFNNAGFDAVSCLAELVPHQMPTRCADNRLWAVANNGSLEESNWGSFVARPDGTIAQQLPKNQEGMLIHEFPDCLSQNGWLFGDLPMHVSDDDALILGKPSSHERQLNPCAGP